MKRKQGKFYQLGTYEVKKIYLSCYNDKRHDDKRHTLDGRIKSLA